MRGFNMDLVVTTSLTPNILTHIYTAAGLRKDMKYYEKYKHTLRKEDVDFLETLKPHFRLRPPVAESPLFTFLFQIPSYFSADNLEGIIDVFDMLSEGLSKGLTTFQGIDPETIEKLNTWIPPEIRETSKGIMEGMFSELVAIINHLKDTVSYTYQSFYREHWKQIKPNLHNKAHKIHNSLKGLSIFDAWSDILGLTYPYDEFVVYLCEAQIGTSLLAEKIAMSSSVTPERASETIIHEIGIHFISPRDYLRRGIAPETFLQNQEALSRMEEASICYLKPQVYDMLGLTLKSDYHIPLMKIEKEIRRFAEVWETKKPDDVVDAIIRSCNLSADVP